MKKYTPQQTAYYEKLKDPRWQKKRLEIMQRDNFTCQCCGETEKTLNVHHKTYKRGRDPWDYTEKCLVTLCEFCHELEKDSMDNAISEISGTLKLVFLSRDIENLNYALACSKTKMHPYDISMAIGSAFLDPIIMEELYKLWQARYPGEETNG